MFICADFKKILFLIQLSVGLQLNIALSLSYGQNISTSLTSNKSWCILATWYLTWILVTLAFGFLPQLITSPLDCLESLKWKFSVCLQTIYCCVDYDLAKWLNIVLPKVRWDSRHIDSFTKSKLIDLHMQKTFNAKGN